MTRWLALVCSVVVLASCGGGAGSGFSPSPSPSPSPSVIVVSLLVNDLLYDSLTGLLLASVPGRAASDGNSIALIDPANLVLEKVIPVGSDPNKLALSGNGSTLYVGLDGEAAIRVVDMTHQTAGLRFTLGSDSNGPFFPEDIAVQPGSRSTIAVSRKNIRFSPKHEGVAIFDNDVMRPTETPSSMSTNVIEFSASSGTLYGYENESTGFAFRTMSVTADGVRITRSVSNLIFGFNVDIKFHPGNGRIYATSGQVIDPVRGELVGTVAVRFAPLDLDPANNLLFFVTRESGTITIRAFNATSLTPVASLAIRDDSFGNPGSVVRWGPQGLAFRTTEGYIFFINPAPGLPTAASRGHVEVSPRRITLSRQR